MKYLVILLAAFLYGCVGNSPYRTNDVASCEHLSKCGKPYEINKGYDLAFVEYTERGHDFNPEQTSDLLKKIKVLSDAGNIALVVFVHGWKHNASPDDDNVKSFQKALARIAESEVAQGKKLVGVYVGWRGMSFHGLELENLTFWDRKATAEQVGRGGVNELLLSLEHTTAVNPSNFMLTVGHSFGAAITLTALHDTLLSKMMATERGEDSKPFGDGVVLLNPAIEAGQAFLLKEHSMKVGAMGKPVRSIMYVVSSRADWATNLLFPWGQFFGVTVRTNQNDIYRRYMGRNYVIPENDLDSETIGNYKMFNTSVMEDDDLKKIEIQSAEAVENKKDKTMVAFRPTDSLEHVGLLATNVSASPNATNKFIIGDWKLDNNCSVDKRGYGVDSFPCATTDPIDFISVPKSFISGHNDIFGDTTISFLSAIVMKSLVEKHPKDPVREYCAVKGVFSFERCFLSYYDINRYLTVKENKEKN